MGTYSELLPDDVDLPRMTYDGRGLISGGQFWAAHLLAQGFDEDEELIMEAFGVDEQEVKDLYNTLTDGERWPSFALPLPNLAGRLWIVYRNEEEDSSVDYVIGKADSSLGAGTRLASLEGGFVGPGLAWSELARVANGADAGYLNGAQCLLLAAPMCSDANAGRQALELVAAALHEVGAGSQAEALAEVLVRSHPMWDLPSWNEDENGVVICDGLYSPRNPHGANALEYSAISAISRALAGVTGGR